MIKRSKFFLLFVLSLFFIFFRLVNKKFSEPKVMLVFQLAKLGDMVCTTPVFRAIKKKYPNSKLIVVGNNINKELLAGNIDIDDYIVFEGVVSTIIKLKNYKIDFGCTMTPSFIALAILIISRVKTITVPRVIGGRSPYEDIWYKILRVFVNKVDHRMGFYAPSEYLNILSSVNINTDETKKYIYFSNNDQIKSSKILKDIGLSDDDIFICISPSVGNKIKQWPIDNFINLIKLILEKFDLNIVLIGTNEDRALSKLIVESVKSDKLFDLSGLLNLGELKRIISLSKTLISVDSGPIYIAEAFGVPTIDIVGPMDENEQPPRGYLNRIVKTDRLAPAIHIMNVRDIDKIEARRQVENIKIKDVFEEFIDLWGCVKN